MNCKLWGCRHCQYDEGVDETNKNDDCCYYLPMSNFYDEKCFQRYHSGPERKKICFDILQFEHRWSLLDSKKAQVAGDGGPEVEWERAAAKWLVPESWRVKAVKVVVESFTLVKAVHVPMNRKTLKTQRTQFSCFIYSHPDPSLTLSCVFGLGLFFCWCRYWCWL